MSEAAVTEQPKPDAAEIARQAEIKKRGAELKAGKDLLNKQRAEILAEQKLLEAEKKELAEFKGWRSQATIDPDAFLTPVYGKDWRDALAKHTAGDATPLAIRQLREEFENQRKADREAEAKRVAAEAAAAAKAEKDKEAAEEAEFQKYVKDISTTWIEERKEKFPTLHGTKMAIEIAKRARAKFKETGEMPNEEEIAAAVEEELDKLIEPVLSSKKWSEKLKAKFSPPSPPVRQTEQPTFSVARKAISQDMASGTKPPEKPLTREQKREKLANMDDAGWNKIVSAVRAQRGTAGGTTEEE